MRLFRCGITVLFLLHFFVEQGFASQEQESYDPQFTSLALNYAIMSVYKVKEMPSRMTVESEYNSITNNLAVANIENDYKLVELIKGMMDAYTEERLDEKDRQLILRAYERRVNIAFSQVRKKSDIYMEAGLNAAMPVLTSLLCGDLGGVARETLSGTQSLFLALQENDRTILQATNQEMEYLDERERNEWALDKEKIRRFNGLQKSLMDANWDLLRRYRLPESSRLTEDDIRAYFNFAATKDPKTALRLAERLQDRLGNYPPFWLVYGNKARLMNDRVLARKCFDSYEKVWRPVLRRDVTMAAMAREKIFVLDENEKDEAKRLLMLIESHKASDDWNTTLFLGLQWFIIGEKAKALKLIQSNIDDNYNVGLNKIILAQLEQGKLELGRIEGIALREFREPSQLEKQAASGDMEAQFRLGELYSDVEVGTDYVQARLWCEKAAAQGHLFARACVAMILSITGQPDAAQKEFSAIRSQLEQRAQANDEQAQMLLGDVQRVVARDASEALRWYIPLAEKGNFEAQRILGYYYQIGRGVPKDEREAVNLYRKAADQGDAAAMHQLGYCYANGVGVTKDEREAVSWYRKAAEQGLAKAQNSLGYSYQIGRGVPKDEREAVNWYRKAAERGLAAAMHQLGYCYENGIGVTKNEREAVSWYRKAAERGLAAAMYQLGYCYATGVGVTKNEREAVNWFLKAAEQGIAIAQYVLGRYHTEGIGVAKDEREAVSWYRKAAEQGLAEAQNNLGYCYQIGRGVPKDEREAVNLYRKAAEQGDASALSNMGYCYENGIGVTKNEREAVNWYRKAAEQGNKDAQKKIGL